MTTVILRKGITQARLDAALATKKALTDYANVVVVDAGGNGDFTSLALALAAITDSDPVTKPYQILMTPGIYVEAGDIALKNGVNVGVLGLGSVRIDLADGHQLVASGIWTGRTIISGLSFLAAGLTNPKLLSTSGSPALRFERCRFTANDITALTTALFPLAHTAGYVEMLDSVIEVLADGGAGEAIVLLSSTGRLILRNCESYAVSGGVGHIRIVNSDTLSAFHTIFFGGPTHVRATSAKTAVIVQCAATAAMINVTSTVATSNFNVQNAGVTF